MALFLEFDRLLSFASVHHFIRSENLLLAAGISVAAQPTPREIDISCGQCLLFKAADQAAVLEILHHGRVRWSRLFSRDGQARIYRQLAVYS